MFPLILLGLGILVLVILAVAVVVPAILVYWFIGGMFGLITAIVSNPFFWLTIIAIALMLVYLRSREKKGRQRKRR